MATYFYQDKAGREIGPLSLDTLAKFRASGVLNADTPVRTADSAEWKPCREIVVGSEQVVSATPDAKPLESDKSVGGQHRWIFVAVLALAIVGGIAYNRRGRSDSANKTPTNQSLGIAPGLADLINAAEGSGTPSEADAKKVITAIIKTEIEFGRSEEARKVGEKSRVQGAMEIINAFDITVADLRKSNGQRGELQGFPIYKLEFEGEIEFALDLEKLRKVLDEKAQRTVVTGLFFNLKRLGGKASSEPTNRWKEAISGVIQFAKTEKGWRASEPVHVVSAKPPTTEMLESYLVSPEIRGIQDARARNILNTCINNLRQIDAAIQQWALENGKDTTATVTEKDLTPYLKKYVVCPSGGTSFSDSYNVTDVRSVPTCISPGGGAAHGHVLPQ